MKNKPSFILGGLATLVLTASFGCFKYININKEFTYHGNKGHLTATHYHYDINNQPCYDEPIRFENGDVIYDGSITTDDGEKISVFILPD